jgi:hypothetical protein
MSDHPREHTATGDLSAEYLAAVAAGLGLVVTEHELRYLLPVVGRYREQIADLESLVPDACEPAFVMTPTSGRR